LILPLRHRNNRYNAPAKSISKPVQNLKSLGSPFGEEVQAERE
jgi:hypothetical protein